MASDEEVLAQAMSDLQNKLYDPRYWLIGLAFIFGIIHMIGSINRDWPVLGMVTNWIRTVLLPIFPSFIQLAILVVVGATLWEIAISWINGTFGGWKSWVSSVVLFWIMVLILLNFPAWIGITSTQSMYSITGIGNLIP